MCLKMFEVYLFNTNRVLCNEAAPKSMTSRSRVKPPLLKQVRNFRRYFLKNVEKPRELRHNDQRPFASAR